MAKNKTINMVKSQVIYKDYSKDAERTALVSGENLSHMFGKIARWYTDISWVGHTHTEANITDFGTYAGASTKGGAATSANKLNIGSADIGSETKPVYFSYLTGKPVACTYSLNASVPANAVFTDINVKQSPSTADESREVLFAGNTGNTETTGTVGKSNKLYFNPNTGALTATSFSGSLAASNLTGTIDAGRLPTTAVTAGSYGPAAGGTLTYGGTFDVPYVTVDKYGRLTAGSTKTFTMPAQYTHPTYTSKTSGLYKITVDGTGHVSGTAAVTASDLPSHTHDYLPLSGGTLTGALTIQTSAFAKLCIYRSGSSNNAAIHFYNDSQSTTKNCLGSIAMSGNPNGGLIRYTGDGSASYKILDTSNFSITQSLASGTKIASFTVNGTTTNLYCEQNTDTTYAFDTGDNNGTIKVTPLGGTAQNVAVKGLGSAAYTESSAYATSGHSHNLSIATSSGTSAITLAASTKYQLTAGGSTYIFTTPPDTKYTHPTYTSKSSGVYKITITSEGHVSAATAATATDIGAMNKKASCVNGANYNDFNTTGFFEALGNSDYPTENAPGGNNTNNNFYVIVQQRATSYFTQIATSVRSDKSMYIRSYTNSTWSDWVEMKYTDENVSQMNTTTNANYRVLFSGTADDTDHTEGIRKSINFRYNPASYRLYIRGGATTGDVSYGATNPAIRFENSNASQNIELLFTDYNAIISPASLALIGNQGNESFLAPKIRAWDFTNNKTSVMLECNTVGTTSTTGLGKIIAGNNIASGTAGNAIGSVSIYGASTYCVDLRATTLTSNRTIYFPDIAGTMTGIIYKATDYYALANHVHSYLPLSGGDITGSINLKSSTYDGSATDNGVSSTSYPTTFCVFDKSNRTLIRTEGIIYPNGNIGWYSYVRNYNTEGTQVAQKGIQFIMNKSGTLTWSVSDPENFRTAIGALSTSTNYALSNSVGGDALRSTNSDKCKVTVTDPASNTKYAIVFVTDPNVSGDNTLRKTDAFRVNHFLGAAGTEGITEIVLGNNAASSAANNSSGHISVYNSDGKFTELKPGTNSTNIRISLPSAEGTLALVGDNNHTHNYIPNTEAGVIAGINLLREATAIPVDDCWYISQENDATTTNFYKRKHSALWSYIKGKADSVYAPKSHSHSYLPLSGGTMTGAITLPKDKYGSSECGLDCNNSNIINANNIKFGDAPDTDGSEGIHYYRSATTWDSLWGKDGVLYFTPNFPSGTTHYTIYHSGNLTYSTIDAASSSHTHGLLDTNLQVSAPNSTTDTWASINAHGTGFVLRSIRTQANAAPYMIGNYSAGIVFGGADTRGVITHAYDTPSVKFAGGNRTAADGGTARWYFTLNATTGQSYALPSTGGTLTDIIYKASNYYATSGHTHSYAKSESVNGPAYSVAGWEGTDAIYRHVWFSTSTDETRRAYNDNFMYSPTQGTLKFTGWIPIDLTGKTDNLNSYNDSTGVYRYYRCICTTQGGGSNITNKPVDSPFVLEVILIRWASSSDYITKQIYHGFDKKTYQRFCTNGTWTAWAEQKYTDTVYTHPSYTAKSSGLYKITVDSLGHISATAAVAAADLPSHTHNYAGSSTAGGNANRAVQSDNCKVTVTDPSSSTTYGIVFVVDPNTTEDNTLRKSNNFRINHFVGAANTEGIIEIVMGNTTAKTAANNSTGRIAFYNSNGKYTVVTPGTGSSNITVTLPTSGGTLALVGDNNHTHNYIPNTEAGMNTAINLLSSGESDPVDDDYFISQYAGGGTTYTSYYRRPVSKLWNYINGKANSVYAAKSHSHSYLPLSGGTLTGYLKLGYTNDSTLPSTGIYVNDIRSVNVPASGIGGNLVNFYFHMTDSPDTSKWWSIMHVKGWNGAYCAWELAGTAHNDDARTRPLYVRCTNAGSAWGSWRKIYDSSNKPTLSELGAAASSHTHNYAGSSTAGGDATRAVNSNNCATTVTNASSGTNYGIVFVADPGASEDNTLRKTYDFRLYHWRGAANTEGITELILGNSTPKTSDKNSSGVVYLYNGIGYWTAINSALGTANITISLPSTGGNMTNIVYQSTSSFVANTRAGMIAGINLLDIATAAPTDDSYYVAQENDGSTTNYYRRKHSAIWSYIKGKADSVYAAASHSHSYLPLSGGTLTGNLSLTEARSILLRPNNSTYTAGIGYDTSGNECIALWAKNTTTRLRWYAGTDMTTMTSGTMMGITPDFEISKASGAAVGYIAGTAIIVKDATSVSQAINALTTGSSTPSDTDYYVAQYAGGGSSTTTYHRRPVSALFSYINSKLYKILWSGSTSCTARSSTSITLTTAISANKYRFIKVVWNCGSYTGVSEFRADTLNVTNNIPSGSDATTTNMIQFKIASDGKSVSVGPGTTTITVIQIAGVYPI